MAEYRKISGFPYSVSDNACKKRVRCVNTDTIYESVTSAAKAIGVTQGSLSAHLIGLNKKCKGLIFEYYTAKE